MTDMANTQPLATHRWRMQDVACDASLMSDPRLYSPSAARNREPILQALRPRLPASGLVLEIASGTGEHVAAFAAALPGLQWQPTDPEAGNRASIDAWAESLPNVQPAAALDAANPAWSFEPVVAVLCINMIHIAPWDAAIGLIAGASRVLGPGGALVLYGPYRHAGMAMEPGNAAFDADLKRRNPAWGLREVETVIACADAAGFNPPSVIRMPADNLTLVFRRR